MEQTQGLIMAVEVESQMKNKTLTWVESLELL